MAHAPAEPATARRGCTLFTIQSSTRWKCTVILSTPLACICICNKFLVLFQLSITYIQLSIQAGSVGKRTVHSSAWRSVQRVHTLRAVAGQHGPPVEAAYALTEPTSARRIHTLCKLLHVLEMYSHFVNPTCM